MEKLKNIKKVECFVLGKKRTSMADQDQHIDINKQIASTREQVKRLHDEMGMEPEKN